MTSKVIAALALGTLLLAGCADASTDTARHLTQSEAQLMAVARFKNYNTGTRTIIATIHDGTDEWNVRGWYDYARDVGYASLTNARGGTTARAAALLLWSKHLLFSRNADGLAGRSMPPLPVPDASQLEDKWKSTPYEPTEFAAHAALLILASLGFDRPENPLLLRQSDAQWLREDHLGKTPVDVFAGPTGASADDSGPTSPATDRPASPETSTVRYWLNRSGLMLRVEMRLGTAEWSKVDFGSPSKSTVVELPDLSALSESEGR
ncbi:hypothetical protein [Leifsonia sp. NPDC058248]|uniref:hypothetical protein n=1 Tax=Leifsonia sp. NPDC058248 TaxID=3346402 RepID=UPI0036DC9C1B